MIKIVAALTLALLISTVSGTTMNAYAGVGGFSGDFDPSNWTEFTEGNGSVDSSNAPDSIDIIGSDSSIGCGGGGPFEQSDIVAPRAHEGINCVTDFTLNIPIECDGVIVYDYFHFGLDSAFFDVPGHTINGVFFPADHGQGPNPGTNTAAVQKGDTFGFRLDATDDAFGGRTVTISNFEPPACIVGGELLPIDSTALVLAGLQTSAIWMLPVLAGAVGSAFGVLYIKHRRN